MALLSIRSLRFTAICLLFFLTTAARAYTQPQTCTAIPDDRSRLACFDSFFSPAVADDGELPPVLPESDAISSEGVITTGVATTNAATTDAVTRDAVTTPLLSRRSQELDLADQRFSITPHRPNYLLPASYNATSDYEVYGSLGNSFNDTEVKFQLSMKTLLARDLWRGSSVWFAYTQQSYWQLYAQGEASSPFRETNYEPELIWDIPVRFKAFGWNARLASLALNHQSNGRAEPLSRSWNRVTAALILDRGPVVASLKSWVRIQEDAEDDDNPDIEEYLGRLQLGLAYKHRNQVFALGISNNLRRDNRGGLEFDWTFPLHEKLRGFLQVYSGYGENLIDAENYNNRIALGFAMTDWL